MTAHETKDGAFVVSSYDAWLPGSFTTARAAKYMTRFSVEDQPKMWEQWKAEHPVPCPDLSFEEMQRWRKTGHFKRMADRFKPHISRLPLIYRISNEKHEWPKIELPENKTIDWFSVKGEWVIAT